MQTTIDNNNTIGKMMVKSSINTGAIKRIAGKVIPYAGTLALGVIPTVAITSHFENEKMKEVDAKIKALEKTQDNPFWTNKFTLGGSGIGYLLAPKIFKNIDPDYASVGGAIAGGLAGHILDKTI